MSNIAVLSIVQLVHMLYVALGIIQNSLVLLVVRCSTESTDSKLLALDKLLVSVLVVLAQPPSGKGKVRLGELVAQMASSPHEHNMLMRTMQ